jgi:hypothetical protein
MFDKELVGREAKAAAKLENIYHKGQSRAWNGKEVLEGLLHKHGGINLPIEKAESIKRIFSVILWGEMAAWKTSADLALRIEPLEAKLAATSQTHDEARHFYVMHDYLNELGYEPDHLTKSVSATLEEVIATKSLAKKLLGMQLMVEPVAITIFRLVRESEIEPVLCELLLLYERDEARHIALGVQYLPTLIEEMSYYQMLSLILWQIKIMLMEVDGLKELEDDFRSLGFEPDDVFNLAESKQMESLQLLGKELGMPETIWEPLRKIVRLKKDMSFREYPSFAAKKIADIIYSRVKW